jgi:hypothetical protein
MSSHLQLYLDRAFAVGCDSALEMHAADVLFELAPFCIISGPTLHLDNTFLEK